MHGLHLIADLHDCRGDTALDDADALRELCLDAVARAGLRAVGSVFHPYVDEAGQAQGVTGVVLLAESHITIHTWPERGFAAIDLFLCGDTRPARALARIERTLAPTRVVTFRRDRGDDADTDR